MEKENLELYSKNQVDTLISLTRSWALNNPTGPVPPLPTPLYTYSRESKSMKLNEKAGFDYPEYRNTHWLIKLLWPRFLWK